MESRPASPEPDHTALFLDVDGTLLDIQPDPGGVVADAPLRELLAALAGRLDGALALVSGRTVQAIDRIFSPLALSAAGAHGAELRVAGGAVEDLVRHELPRQVMESLQAFAAEHKGILLEAKPGGASLHYRRAPALEHVCRDFVQGLMDYLHSDYRIIDGKMVLELAPKSASKGEAVYALMRRPPFGGRRPVFIGDDVTDEDGFRAVNALGGTSILVGQRAGTEAAHSLADVADVHRWLARLLEPPCQKTDGDTALVQP